MLSLIEKYAEELPLTVTRYGPGTRSGPRTVPGPTTTLQIKAAVMPLGAMEMAQLPEGRDVKAAIKLYTHEPLKVGHEADMTRGDRVSYQGEDYEVKTTTGRDQLRALKHYLSIAYLVEEQR